MEVAIDETQLARRTFRAGGTVARSVGQHQRIRQARGVVAQRHNRVGGNAVRVTAPHARIRRNRKRAARRRLRATGDVGRVVADTKGRRGYRFGDITRGIVSRGARVRGEPATGYRFGDFTRGVFGRVARK